MALDIIGIVVSLALLIFLAYRGWNVIMIAPFCAAVALLFSWGESPLLATYTQIFMPAHAFLDDLARESGVPDVATAVVASSAVARSIVQIARDRAVELIVVGSRSREGLDWLFGSTTDTVVRRAPCDVLVIRD